MRFVGIVLLALVVAGPSAAQELPSQPNAEYNPRAAEGYFDLVIRVDGEAYVSVRGDQVRYQVVSGAPLRDAGSNYSQPVPEAVYGAFNMRKIAGRGVAELVEEPNRGNDYTALIRINDSRAGAELYHLRLDWTWNPADPSRAPGNRNTRPLDANVGDPRDYNRRREGEFVFRGRVDQISALYIRSDQVRMEQVRGQILRGERYQFSQPLPAVPLDIELVDVRGRGVVELVEKPWEGNRYTAVVRLEDAPGGAADYTFRLIWRVR